MGGSYWIGNTTIPAEDGKGVRFVGGFTPKRKQDLDFMIVAVNSHDDLLEAAKNYLLTMVPPDMSQPELTALREAIARAEGKA